MGKCDESHAAVGRNFQTLSDRAGCDNLDPVALQPIFGQVQRDSHVSFEAEQREGTFYFKRIGRGDEGEYLGIVRQVYVAMRFVEIIGQKQFVVIDTCPLVEGQHG